MHEMAIDPEPAMSPARIHRLSALRAKMPALVAVQSATKNLELLGIARKGYLRQELVAVRVDHPLNSGPLALFVLGAIAPIVFCWLFGSDRDWSIREFFDPLLRTKAPQSNASRLSI